MTSNKTFFDTLGRSFVDVPITADGVDTATFLEAAESLLRIFDMLGSTAFSPVKADISGNITKVRNRLLEAPDKSSTLQQLVANELAEKKHTATEGLLWLIRGLDFTCQALTQNLVESVGALDVGTAGKEELSTSFRTAYGNTLKQYHNFIVKQIFSVAMSATPYRKDFYAKLGEDQEVVGVEARKWLAAMGERVKILKEYLATIDTKWK